MKKTSLIPQKSILLFLVISFLVIPCHGQATNSWSSALHFTIYGKNAKAGKYVTIRGFRMYYETYGKGAPLLMIHGNGGSISDFLYQIPYFSKRYKVIVADSRAQGKSVDLGDSLSYEMMADDLSALLDRLHVDSCYVIGWSDGGIEGLLLAIRHPDKVKKLAVTGANLWPDTTAAIPWVVNFARQRYDSLLELQQTPQIKNDVKLTHLLLYEPHITLSELHTIHCPTLIIGGDEDVIWPQHTLLIFENITKAYLWILPDSGHFTPVFYRNEFNKTTGSFFNHPYKAVKGLDHFLQSQTL
ncbi:MAG: alpha/beta hydrolase [Chitinophagaceae bacterium]|nr:MAG: alpha/beta hydrolase [Chitinophagaceae bacterium]